MKVNLDFVELHSPLFFDGVNFGSKLYSDPKKSKAPIEMWYDTDLRLTFVIYKGKLSLIENVSSMTVTDPMQFGVSLGNPKKEMPTYVKATETMPVRAQASGPEKIIRTAQVSTPMDKVQGTPGRKAKYQGEESQGE